MFRARAASLSLLLAACAREPARDATRTPSVDERVALHEMLLKAGVLDAQRQLVHLSRVCTLEIGGQTFTVADVMELVKGATTPRGINRIVVLDQAGVPVQTIAYVTERPLFCRGDRLYVFGHLAVGGVQPEGNVLQFVDGGRRVVVTDIDVNDLPGDQFAK